MAHKESLKDFDPFFGGDLKGGLFVQAMFNGSDYTSRPGGNSGLMTELLRAENYNDYQKLRSVNGRQQSPDDVPQDVTDLIITTALFHSKIDKTATAGTNLGAAIKLISDSLNDYLSMNFEPSSSADVPATTALANAPNVNVNRIYSTKTNADHLLYFMADRAAWDAYHNASPGLSNQTDIYGKTTINDIDTLNNCSGSNKNLCLGSGLDNSKVTDAFNKIGNLNNFSTFKNAIQESTRKIIIDIIADMKREMISKYNFIRNTVIIGKSPMANHWN